MFLADFHMHSTFSDGVLTVAELVDLYGRAGFGCIAITDHLCETRTPIGKIAHAMDRSLTPEKFQAYRETIAAEAARAWDQYNMVVLAGYELTKNYISNSRSAHVLGLGVTEFMPADLDITEQALLLRAQGAVSVAAHPVPTGRMEKQALHLWDRRRELASLLDAWEISSGRFLFEEVRASKLPVLASSDLHHPKQFGSWKTVLNCERHPQAILDAIRKQDLDIRFYEAPTEPVQSRQRSALTLPDLWPETSLARPIPAPSAWADRTG